jgi:serine/threonine protein kinase
VPGFIIAGEPGPAGANGSQWAAVRSLDGRQFVLKVLPVPDTAEAQILATRQMAGYDVIESEHLVRRHGAIALADSTLALVLDEVTGGSLAQLLGVRGQLTPGETVTTVAPLFRALAGLHAAGVVHGDLAPGNVVFSADGRPLIADLGVARLVGGDAGAPAVACGFSAPELAGGDTASPSSDVYAMGAIGWLCLTGAPPAPAARRPSLVTLRPDAPARLAEILTACLATDPAARPPAGSAAVKVFDAAPAESVALVPVCDPAAEITRRIRAVAASVSVPAPTGDSRRYRTPLVLGLVALLLAMALGVGATWFLGRRADAASRMVTVPASTRPSLSPASATATATRPAAKAPSTTRSATTTKTTKPATKPANGQAWPTKTSGRTSEVMTAPSAPRTAAAGLLQALVGARALAYVARDPVLLDLVYAPGAPQAAVDKGNIAAARKNGGTYLGLSFLIRDAVFQNGTSTTARIQATIVTPAYRTGQPDGRTIPHAQEILGPCVFTLTLTPDGWRILGLSVP